MLNKQLWGAILPGGVRARINVFAFILLAFFSLTSCEDPMSDISVDDLEITTEACKDSKCEGDEDLPPGG